MENYTETYKETDNYKGEIQHLNGFVLIHLHIKHWSPSVYKELHSLFHEVRDKFRSEGYEEMYTTTVNPLIVKFAKKVHPIYDIQEIGGQYDEETVYVIMWETGL